VIEAAVAKGSIDPFVWYARAMELRSLGRLEEALAAYGEVAARFPDYVPTYLMAGQVAVALGRVDVARELLEAGIGRAEAAGDSKALAELEAAHDGLG
jgi:tetratricopeptide (TPR) repeat protein